MAKGGWGSINSPIKRYCDKEKDGYHCAREMDHEKKGEQCDFQIPRAGLPRRKEGSCSA